MDAHNPTTAKTITNQAAHYIINGKLHQAEKLIQNTISQAWKQGITDYLAEVHESADLKESIKEHQ